MALSERQITVLRSLVSAYVGEAGPVGSATLAEALPFNLSSASVRSVLAELTELGLVEKPHPSAGRIPTATGLRLFVDELLAPERVGDFERREVAREFDAVDSGDSMRTASEVLSQHTRQLGFVMLPRLERVTLRHLSLVRLSSERLLVILISHSGVTYQRVIEDDASGNQTELDRLATSLNQRLAGRTLVELGELLRLEVRDLRTRAERMMARALRLAVRVLSAEAGSDEDIVIAARLALLDQPEFQDPHHLRELLAAIEARQTLVNLLDRMVDCDRVAVTFGQELADPVFFRCAVVAAPYGEEGSPLGWVGVLGPRRMNYGRVIPLVDYVSQLVTQRVTA